MSTCYIVGSIPGNHPIQDWMGVPLSRTGWGTPIGTGWGTSSRTGLDGVSPPGQDWMGYPSMDGVLPIQDWMGYPAPIRRQSSIVNTCHMTGGMPLAFMQEDCLVLRKFSFNTARTQFEVLTSCPCLRSVQPSSHP